jgi:enoyl-[acyl-carrier-protein] reductase (NADH)
MAFNLLKGKKGIIFGALNSNSIAWKIAERAHEEGAELLLTNTPLQSVWAIWTNLPRKRFSDDRC